MYLNGVPRFHVQQLVWPTEGRGRLAGLSTGGQRRPRRRASRTHGPPPAGHLSSFRRSPVRPVSALAAVLLCAPVPAPDRLRRSRSLTTSRPPSPPGPSRRRSGRSPPSGRSRRSKDEVSGDDPPTPGTLARGEVHERPQGQSDPDASSEMLTPARQRHHARGNGRGRARRALKSRLDEASATRARDPPHARGDGDVDPVERYLSAGSPPRPWGRRGDPELADVGPGITPTLVGRAKPGAGGPVRFREHPHACGEGRPLEDAVVNGSGSPPHGWGGRELADARSDPVGITPTRVGRAAPRPAAPRRARDHPHARGEGLKSAR